jgi:hypothetical protein
VSRYKKVFLIVSISVGILQCVFWSLKIGVVTGVLFGAIAGIITGGVITFIIRVIYQNKSETYTYEKRLEFNIPHDKVFNLCTQAVSRAKRHKIRLSDESQGIIIVKLRMGWESYGETITFKIDRIDNKKTSLIVSAKLPIPSPTYNFDRTETIVSHLKQLAQTYEET